MSDEDPIDLLDDLFDEACPNCGARLRAPNLPVCPRCAFVLNPEAVDVDAAEITDGSSPHPSHAPTRAAEAPPPEPFAVVPPTSSPTSTTEVTPTPASAAPSVETSAVSVDDSQPADSDDSDDATDGPKTIGHAGGTRIALALAGIAVTLLIVAYIAGWHGLFPREEGLFRDSSGNFTAATVRWGERFSSVVRMLVLLAVLWAAAVGALWGLAKLRNATVPDWPAAAARMAAIVAATATLGLLELPSRFLELTIEIALQAALFVGLVVLWFKLGFSDALQLLGMAAIAVVGLHLAALLVVWATSGVL